MVEYTVLRYRHAATSIHYDLLANYTICFDLCKEKIVITAAFRNRTQ